MNLSISANRMFVITLSVWLIISSIYYIDNLFSGVFLGRGDADFLKNVIKYVVASFFSVYIFLIRARVSHFIFYIILILLVISALIVLLLFDGIDLNFGINELIIFISFSGFVFLIENTNDRDLSILIGAIICSGFLVGFFSIYERFFLEDVMSPYWHATGGYRSVSTLLNPNNMGLYICAVLILTMYTNLCFFKKILLFFLFISLIIVSGSRTALISLLFSFLFIRSIRAKLITIPFIVFFMVLPFILYFFYEIGFFYGRAVDMTTAVIRMERYSHYLTNIDITYLIPDFSLTRFGWVSESAYFHLLNSLGWFITFVLVIIFYLLFFWGKVGTNNAFDEPHFKAILSFKHVFIFYLIASLFEGVFTSFPNNQLFFISMGALFFQMGSFRKIDA